jgi:hypothetical protein
VTRFGTAWLALALSFGGASPAWAAMTESPSGIDGRLRFEWEASQSRNGRPLIDGYLYNDWKRLAYNVTLLVEVLDASGQVTQRVISMLPGAVPAFNRVYFEVPLAAPGASYRISVTSFEWYAGGM